MSSVQVNALSADHRQLIINSRFVKICSLDMIDSSSDSRKRTSYRCDMSTMFPRKRRKRTIITAEQLLRLECLFKQEQWPGREKKEELAREIEMSTHFVNIWFQNKRSRVKKLAQEEEEIEAMKKRLLEATAGKQSPCIAPRSETHDRPVDLVVAQPAAASIPRSSVQGRPASKPSRLPVCSPPVAFDNAAVLLPNTDKTKSAVILATINHPANKLSASVPLMPTHNSGESMTAMNNLKLSNLSQMKPTFWKSDKVVHALPVAPADRNARLIYGTDNRVKLGLPSFNHGPNSRSLSVSYCSSSPATTTASPLFNGFMPTTGSFTLQTSDSSNKETTDQLTSQACNSNNQRPLLPSLDAIDLCNVVKKTPAVESPLAGSSTPMTLLRCLILMMALSERTGTAFGLKPADFDLAVCASTYGVKLSGQNILQYDNKRGFLVSKPVRKKKRKKEKGKEKKKKSAVK